MLYPTRMLYVNALIENVNEMLEDDDVNVNNEPVKGTICCSKGKS